jgi:hypothetical protein
MRNSLFALLLLAVAGCGKSPEGVAHKAVDELYPNMGFSRKIYTESMIRAALGVANLDSGHVLSRNTEYLMQFEVARKDRWYLPTSDSIIMHHLLAANAELMLEFSQKGMQTSVFVIGDEAVVNDLIIFQSDTSALKIYEFVGHMPMDELLKAGMNNYAQFTQALNLDILGNGRRDSTNN